MTETSEKIEGSREVVLAVNELSARAHRELYCLDSGIYQVCSTDILSCLKEIGSDCPDRLHISTDWENLLRIALWSSAPPIFDVIGLLRKSGASDSELEPFRKSDLNDLLPWLYYGRKFDILRRLCNAAKTKVEEKTGRKGFHAYCHLVSDESGRIIASSL